MTAQSPGIRLGVDLGNTGIKVAYVYPDGGRAVVALPVGPTQAGARLPMCEHLPVNDQYVPPFFPGLTQRIEKDFIVRVGHERRTTAQLVADAMAAMVATARNYSGATVEGILLALPAWQPQEARVLLREAILSSGLPQAMLATHSDCAAAHVRAEMMSDRKHETALLVSIGYTGLQIAVIRLTQKGHRVLAESASQAVLAGNCLDFSILHSALHQLRKHEILISGIRDASPDSVNVWVETQRRAELAKHELADAPGAVFAIPVELLPGSQRDAQMRINGLHFHSLVERQLDAAVEMIDQLLQEAGVETKDVDHVILEGGGAHLPGVSTRLGPHFPSAELRYLPRDALASGAALLAMEGEFRERFDAPSAYSGARFVPDLQLIPELVQLASERAEAPPEPRVEPPPPPAATQPPPADRPIEDMTLSELKSLGRVDPGYALRRLMELQDALKAQIKAVHGETA